MNKFISLFIALFIVININACAPNVIIVCPAAHEEPSAAPSDTPTEEAVTPTTSPEETEVLTSIPTTPGLIRMAGTNVYYWFGRNGRRYYFPSSIEMLSWSLDESDARIVSSNVLSSIIIGGNVTMRAGTFPVRINTQDFQYAVGHGGVLHLYLTDLPGYATRSEAHQIYSPQILPTIALNDGYFVNYSVGRSITDNGSRVPDGTVFIFSDDNTRRYVAWQGTMRRILTTQAFEANHFEETFVVTTDARNRTAYTVGLDITGHEPLLSDPAGAN